MIITKADRDAIPKSVIELLEEAHVLLDSCMPVIEATGEALGRTDEARTFHLVDRAIHQVHELLREVTGWNETQHPM